MDKWIDTVEAASIAKKTRATIVLWCKRYPGMGRKIAGRWEVNVETLDDMLEGRYDSKEYK